VEVVSAGGGPTVLVLVDDDGDLRCWLDIIWYSGGGTSPGAPDGVAAIADY
jgi:hypothetical protein